MEDDRLPREATILHPIRSQDGLCLGSCAFPDQCVARGYALRDMGDLQLVNSRAAKLRRTYREYIVVEGKVKKDGFESGTKLFP